jgi:4-amino-4-deoxy-L-arabinose transferase-like glycosyltransferase
MIAASADRRFTILALALAVLVNLVAIDLPIMGSDDATLYAGIAAAMVRTGDYVGLYAWGQDWLDKPHLPFWLTALSFRLFGVTPWAYRLPAFLAIVTAAIYTARLGTRWYGPPVGVWAAIALLTAQHTILSSGDVRAEPFVACFLIACTWYLVRMAEDDAWLGAAVAGGICAALAMMSKGGFTLIPVAGGLGGHWLARGRPPIRWGRWAVVALVAAAGITPELWALDLQFDRHPEKVVFGRTGVSGIRFFLWDSQLGRFFGTGPIHRNKSNPFYFVHTVVWAFLPWSILLGLAIGERVKLLLRRSVADLEWFTLAGAGLMFVVFSVSQFQLPYYLNIIFPYFAILVAAELARRTDESLQVWSRIQLALLVTMVILVAALGVLAEPGGAWWPGAGAIACLGLIPVALRSIGRRAVRILVSSALVATAVNLFLERGIVRALLPYEGGRIAALFVNQRYPDTPVVVARDHQYTGFDFALARLPRYIDRLADTSAIESRPYLILVATKGPPDPRTIRSFDYSVVSRPTLRFINRRTRPHGVLRLDLVLVSGQGPERRPDLRPGRAASVAQADRFARRDRSELLVRQAPRGERPAQRGHRLVDRLGGELEGAEVHRDAPPGAEIHVRRYRLGRIEVDVAHEPAGLVRTDRQQGERHRAEPAADLGEMRPVAGIAGEEHRTPIGLDHEPAPECAVPVPGRPGREMLGWRDRERDRIGGPIPPVELGDSLEPRGSKQAAVA